jgi:small-conductance mechanosensitive channel
MNVEDFRGVLSRLTAALAWTPDWIVGAGLLIATAGLALALHWLGVLMIRRAIGRRHVFLQSMIEHSKGPTRLALVIFALGLVLQAAPFDFALAQVVSHALLVAFIVLIGWIAAIAIRIAADIYLRRYRSASDDDLLARKHTTQVRILERAAYTLTVVITAACVLMTFESVRHYGVSLFASAGLAGIVVGLAARPLLTNLIAGVQIAVTQPIRLGDAVVVENEWGWVEEIAATYVVIRLWDERRLIVPLSEFIEKSFQNWTRNGSALIGSVMLHVDYTAPVERIRAKLAEIVPRSKLWDGRVVSLQVTDCTDATLELRALVSARSSPALWDLRCEVREKLIAFLQAEHPGSLPRRRAELEVRRAIDVATTGQRPATEASAA